MTRTPGDRIDCGAFGRGGRCMLTFSILKVVHNLPEKVEAFPAGKPPVGTPKVPNWGRGTPTARACGRPARRWRWVGKGWVLSLSHLRETWTRTAFMLILHQTTKTTLHTSPIHRRLYFTLNWKTELKYSPCKAQWHFLLETLRTSNDPSNFLPFNQVLNSLTKQIYSSEEVCSNC